jgi:predicted PurR-regulated permease PerM
MPEDRHESDGRNSSDWFSRERSLAFALFLSICVLLYLSFLVVVPFVRPLAWALALALVAHPLHRRVQKWIPLPNVAAACSVLVVTFAIVIPVVFVSHSVIQEATRLSRRFQSELTPEYWQSIIDQNPRLRLLQDWLQGRSSNSDTRGANDERINAVSDKIKILPRPFHETDDPHLRETSIERSRTSNTAVSEPPSSSSTVPLEQAATVVTQGIASIVSGTIWLCFQLFITLLALFFFFRDELQSLQLLRSLMPLTDSETTEVFSHVQGTIHATVYGSLVVAFVQGAMGGLMFWWLKLPSPLLWGVIMGLLAVVPVLGTFVIWAPTALFLALRGDITSALILAAWGGIAIGLIDNILYPFLVGKRLQYHTFLVFIAIVGGIGMFGASGVILGPVLLSITDVGLQIWRKRTANGGTLETGVQTAENLNSSFNLA